MQTKVGISNYQILEKEYSNFVGSKFGISVNSGTSALHLALVALGIGKGDEVIVPDFTMAACGFAVSYTGAKVVTVDCGDDLNIDVDQIIPKITKRTKAIMAVHIYGRLCGMSAILKIANEYNLLVIEDACEAQGAVKKSKADVTCYSFFKNKIIHAEEGGIITTNKKILYDKMQFLKNMAFDSKHSYYHSQIGFNYRLPDSQAKMALQSLKSFEENNRKRKEIESVYNNFLSDLAMPKRDAVWVFDILTNKREVLIKSISGARYFFKPLSTMPMWKQHVGQKALFYSKHGMYLPVHPSMGKKEVLNICKKILSLVTER